MKASIAISLAFVAAATAIFDICTHDNVLRCLLGDKINANPFCISYISIPTIIHTYSTTTPCVTVTKGHNWPRNAEAQPTKVMDLKARRQAAINSALAKLKPPSITAAPNLELRGFPFPKLFEPQCLTQVSSSSYSSSRISSACSCLDIPKPTFSYVFTAKATTVTIDFPLKAKRTLQAAIAAPTQAVDKSGVPTGSFRIRDSRGSELVGVLEDDFYTGFGLPYGEYGMYYTIDKTTGYVSASSLDKDETRYLVAYTGLLAPGNKIPYVVTESSPMGQYWTPLSCRVGKDATGKFPLMCRAGDYTVLMHVVINGDGHNELGLARPEDRSGDGEVALYAELT